MIQLQSEKGQTMLHKTLGVNLGALQGKTVPAALMGPVELLLLNIR